MSDFEAILETGGAAAVEYAAAVIAEHGGATARCANCREPLLGPYCAVCGQPHDVHRRSVGRLLKDFFQDLASFDSRILRTAKALLFQPGELARAYHDGRTQPYVPAVRLYLFVTLLFFLVLSASGIALMQFELRATPIAVRIDAQHHPYTVEGGEKTVLPQRYADGKPHYDFTTGSTFFTRLGSVHSGISRDARRSMADLLQSSTTRVKDGAWITNGINGAMAKLATDPAALNGAITAWLPRILFLLLPLFALLLAAFYWRQRRDFLFVDHLVFSLSFHSFAFVLLLLAALAAQALPGGVVAWIFVLAVPLYLLLAMKRLYRQSWFWTGVKFASVITIYTMFFLFPAFFGVLALSVFGVEGPHLG